MKQRTKDYINRKKALRSMQHPDDLESLLIAEYDSSRNIIVKKDILNMLESMQQQQPVTFVSGR